MKNGRVCDLISDGAWNLSQIREFISEEEAGEIIKLSIPHNNIEDKLCNNKESKLLDSFI